MKPSRIKYEFLPFGCNFERCVYLLGRHVCCRRGKKALISVCLTCKFMQNSINSIPNADILLLECYAVMSLEKKSFFKSKPLFWRKDDKAEHGVKRKRY